MHQSRSKAGPEWESVGIKSVLQFRIDTWASTTKANRKRRYDVAGVRQSRMLKVKINASLLWTRNVVAACLAQTPSTRTGPQD